MMNQSNRLVKAGESNRRKAQKEPDLAQILLSAACPELKVSPNYSWAGALPSGQDTAIRLRCFARRSRLNCANRPTGSYPSFRSLSGVIDTRAL